MKDIIKLILCIILVCSCKYAQASLEDRKKINSLDLSMNEDLVILNNYLYGGDILNHFKIREKLLSFSYEELLEINQQIKIDNLPIQLNNLIEDILSKMEQENLLLLQEEIYVNNTPTLLDCPFYDDEQEFKITDLKPHAERLYFNNLKLKYQKNNLRAITDNLWINPVLGKGNRRRKQDVLYEEVSYLPVDSLLNETEKLWSYTLRSDNLVNWVYTKVKKTRQRIKRYEENSIYPIFYKGKIILRNEYRLFCIDLLTGRELWTFNLDESGHEFYQTIRHPHHNSYGYEMLLEEDVVYTELAGKLVAVRIKDNYRPRLLWEKNLGEYTVCIKPVKSENSLIVGLVNARQELWICGFDPNSGSLEWSTYIGINSFLSPACVISVLVDNKIVLGTNHGVLVCLKPDNGEIIWLRKYTPKKYSYFEYWFKGHYKGKFLDKGFIAFDTQFIEVGNDGFLYYKPRESDYLYVLDSKNGTLKEELLIDSDKYYLLKAADDKIVLLEKSDDTESAELKVVQLKTGKQIYGITLQGGSLENVIQVNKEETLFKVDDIVYYLRIGEDNNVEYSKIKTSPEGWLFGFDNGYLLIGENRKFYCLSAYYQKDAVGKYSQPSGKLFNLRDRVKNNLIKAIKLNAESEQVGSHINNILNDIRASMIPVNEIMPIIMTNLKRLRSPQWEFFFSELKNIYNNETISYRDIEIKFSNFLYKSGLAKSDKVNQRLSIKGKPKKKSFQVKGGGIRLVPVNVIEGPQSLNFFVMLNFDQLLCINEAGHILWDRKAYYVRNFLSSPRQWFGRSIKAYLYKNVLLFNDSVNIVAVDVNDGHYIWSMTNKGVPDSSKFFRPDGAIKFHSGFLNDKVVIFHGKKIYSVDPITGYCKRFNELDITGATEMLISNDQIFILSRSITNIKVLNEQLEIKGDFELDYVKDQIIAALINKTGIAQRRIYDKAEFAQLIIARASWLTEKNIVSTLKAIPDTATGAEFARLFLAEAPVLCAYLASFKTEMIIANDLIALSSSPYLYLIDARSGELKGKINIGNFNECRIEIYNNNLLVIIPFKKLININLDDNSLSVDWELKFESDELFEDYLTPRFTGNQYYHFMVDKNIIVLTRNKGGYWLVSVDIESGEKIWRTPIDKSEGFFVYLSPYKRMDNLIYFIFSTSLEDCLNEAYNTVMPKDMFTYDISSGLFELDISSGDITTLKRFPTVSTPGFQRSILVDTKEYLISSVNAVVITGKRK